MKVSVLGSSGSVGGNALKAASSLGIGIYGVSVNRDTDKLRSHIEAYKPSVAVITDSGSYREFINDTGNDRFGTARVLCGETGLREMTESPSSGVIVNAISGIAGLEPTLRALEAGKKVATANKESIVMGWPLIKERLSAGGELIPVDSEHSAVFQLIEGVKTGEVRKVILTASGGAVYGKSADELRGVTPDDCLSHPTWDMGEKITVDSATLMNKGLEIIEASHLFDLGFDMLDVLIHPQSLVHAMVEFTDGSLFAHIAPADMRIPISYAISHPARAELPGFSLDAADLARLEFYTPDRKRFPCLDLAVDAGRRGGEAPVVLCAADEAAVRAFLNGSIGFTDIPGIISRTLEKGLSGSLESSGGIIELYERAFSAAVGFAEGK